MPKIDVDGLPLLRGRAIGIVAVIACASAFAACGGSNEKDSAATKPAAAKSTPAATPEQVATDDSTAEAIPGDTAPEEATTDDAATEDDSSTEETEDETAAKEAVALYVVAAAGGDGEGACSRLTWAAITLILADDVERTNDEAYQACLDGIAAASVALPAKQKAALENTLLTDVAVDGDTASVMTSLNRTEPITLVRGEDGGWLLDYLPEVTG